MLDTLAKICDDGGPLVGVSYTLFESDPRFITAVGLRFESLSAVLRAVPDDDTLAVSLGLLAPEPGETLIDAAASGPWPACMGLGVCWAWCLTNQQGYSDGLRLEFSEPGRVSSAVVEVVVAASAMHVFVAVPGATA
jgi:Family of unknown function (DUF6334)